MSDLSRDKAMAEKIAEKVQVMGGRTFYVGGYVRDLFLGKENKDIDIEIHELSLDDIKKVLSSLGKLDERKVGDHFGIFNLQSYDIDIAMPRSEKSVGNGHKDFIIDVDPFIGYEKAAARRDFTINAMMQDVLSGEILDYFGGRNDLSQHIIRHVDSQTFSEDPLRVYRAAQFAARFGFNIADETTALSSRMSLTDLSHERVAMELSKALLKAEKPSVFFYELRKMHQLEAWFPEVAALIDIKQEPSHHPEGDAFRHTMLVLDEAAKLRNRAVNPEYFMVSALCHDFGKAVTTQFNPEKQKWQSLGHDEAGREISMKFVERIYNNKDMAKYVDSMVSCHMRPLRMFTAKSSNKKFMHLFDETVCAEDLILLAKADNDGRGIVRSFDDAEKFLIDKLAEYKELMTKPQVTGKDLVSMGYIPGPQFTEMLEYTHKVHLAGRPKDDAIRHLQGLYHLPRKAEKSSTLIDDNCTATETSQEVSLC